MSDVARGAPRARAARLGVLAASLAVTLGLTGCTVVVDGALRRPVGIKRILLDERELTHLTGERFRLDPKYPPRFGGENLVQSAPMVSPPECAGVLYRLSATTYEVSKPQSVGEQTWWNAGAYLAGRLKVISVDEAVAALPTAQAAGRDFAAATRKWQGCNGTTAVDPTGRHEIGDVGVVGSVLSATVATPLDLDNEMLWQGRALGVSANCLVDVTVAFFTDNPRRKTAAADMARTMLNKLRAASC